MRANPFEKLDTGIEISEDFIPNHNLTYEIHFDGNKTFLAKLEENGWNDGCVGVEDAPKELKYELTKPLSDFTVGEQLQILDYRGLTLEDGFEPMDVFMEKSFIKLITEVPELN
jgi:hypothetical protein